MIDECRAQRDVYIWFLFKFVGHEAHTMKPVIQIQLKSNSSAL